jgi:hypothetical protein
MHMHIPSTSESVCIMGGHDERAGRGMDANEGHATAERQGIEPEHPISPVPD